MSSLKIIAGPCVIESLDHALRCAHEIAAISENIGEPIIYKSSFDKANRSSASSYRGVGIQEGLRILQEVKAQTGLEVLTDIHTPEQAAPAAEVVDVLQTPAFLCRQTDFIAACARTGKALNIKKGQFCAPGDMANVVEKARLAGAGDIWLCERGSTFGYGDLVVDMRGLDIMRDFAPVIFDATHSCQRPGALGKSSGGNRDFVPGLARAAVAYGVAGVFLETHPDPDNAPCDGPNMWPLDQLEPLLLDLLMISEKLEPQV